MYERNEDTDETRMRDRYSKNYGKSSRGIFDVTLLQTYIRSPRANVFKRIGECESHEKLNFFSFEEIQ